MQRSGFSNVLRMQIDDDDPRNAARPHAVGHIVQAIGRILRRLAQGEDDTVADRRQDRPVIGQGSVHDHSGRQQRAVQHPTVNPSHISGDRDPLVQLRLQMPPVSVVEKTVIADGSGRRSRQSVEPCRLLFQQCGVVFGLVQRIGVQTKIDRAVGDQIP